MKNKLIYSLMAAATILALIGAILIVFEANNWAFRATFFAFCCALGGNFLDKK